MIWLDIGLDEYISRPNQFETFWLQVIVNYGFTLELGPAARSARKKRD
jgi:hypothetical protein